MASGKFDAEKEIKRNPHGDFKAVEASRPPFDTSSTLHFTQTPKPDWQPGQGPNEPSSLTKSHRQIDPYAEGRPAVHNYKLLISAIVPRPVGFTSTISADGKSTNLAPFSYFNLMSHDPPIFVLGFSGGLDKAKDTLKNLLDTKEAVVNIITEEYIEAANYTSINAPEGVSEWAFSGLHAERSTYVKPDRVKEAVFSIEAKLIETREWTSKNPATPDKKTSVTVFLEGVNFWVRHDAIDEQGVLIDPAVMKPISRLGGISYGRTTQIFELPRPDYEEVTKDPEIAKLAKPKGDSQI
ncbi:flavo protein-like protein oxygenase [Cucurbitaria berberidis CBS 394.84]|uniref:Flavo protein-like protein oxygenase n=1 Tax=Cucurbitaria berberidis CBS 394.84 TaxID=1168544 RepID=A0A9P4GEU5_9PLEO|nr:flavo protein-like protein oxygenase [Cucurbitaria berberidis CBS 394.84]KAF1844186.1 flavo protein-like protein oxygenase [Cucurbitaria berberidis CBS 394.84]